MAQKVMDMMYGSKQGFLTTYKRIRVGQAGWLFFCWFELVTTLFMNLQGALGLVMRRLFYPPLFKACGRGVVIGAGVVLRNPRQITLGDRVVLDDLCVLDAKGEAPDGGITLGNGVFISRHAILGCKSGHIRIGDGTCVGPHSTIHAVEPCSVTIGTDVLIAAYCYVVGAPHYGTARNGVPMAKQGFLPAESIEIGNDIWLGASVVVSQGSRIHDGAIVGTMAMVRGEIPPYAVAFGIPARVHHYRGETDT